MKSVSVTLHAVALVLLATPAVQAKGQTTPTQQPAATNAASTSDAANPSDTVPLGDLMDDPASKAVLDKDIPGLTTFPNIDRVRRKTLKQIQASAGGRITDEMLAKTDADLIALKKTPASPAPQ